MIFKSAIGTGITAIHRYVMGPGRDEHGKAKTEDRARVIGGHGFGFPVTERNIAIAIAIMEQNGRPEMQAGKTFICSKDAMHIKLSWAPGQTPDDQEKTEAARAFLEALGMANAMHTIVEHNDKSFKHIHINASRIDPDTGLAYDDFQRVYRGQERALRWEEERDQITKDRMWCHRIRGLTRGQPQNRELADTLFQNEAAIERKRIDLYMAWGGHFGPHLDAAREGFVRDNKLVPLKKYARGRTAAYTTEEIWREETQAIGKARRINDNTGFEVSDDVVKQIAKEMTLTKEQQDVLRRTTRDNGISFITGEAGTGKSHVMKAIRKAYERSGFPVRGLAHTNRVTQQMQSDGFRSDTIASQLLKLKFGHDTWDPRTVVAIDEAAQMSTEQMNDLMREIERQGAKMIPVGHRKQLGSIERGGLFGPLTREFGAGRLTEIMRTKHDDQKRAFSHMARRRYDQAVEIFKKDSIRWNDTKDESIKSLAQDYAKDFSENPDLKRQIVANTNDDVGWLNEEVRNLWKIAGRIRDEHSFDTSKGPRMFGVGDRIAMNETPNQKDKKKGLINGAYGSVTDITVLANGQKEITVDIDRKKDEQRRLFKFNVGMNQEEGEVSGIDHGYAGTTYKAQGSTFDRTYMVHNPKSTSPTNYVGLTRHRDRTTLYVSRDETDSHEQLAEQLKHGDDKTAAHDYMIDRDERERIEQAPADITEPGPAIEPAVPSVEPAHPILQNDQTNDAVIAWIKKYAGNQRGEAGKDLEDQTQATDPGLFIRRDKTKERSR